MLWYLIDGYNVIHKSDEIKKSASPRQEFVYYIKRKNLTGSRNNKVTIVFDGGPHYDEFLQEKEFSIVFSMERSADDVIKEKIARAKNKKQIVVVSDDREILQCARTAGARIVRAGEFLTEKQKRIEKEDGVVEKNISLSVQEEITEELRKIWLKDETET
ncbi:MAG: NYN domain-containing protein [Candidatus Omnitrophica bacterium]|nr:NYN domain-containing protein [Candidatus Omnitrophota bacterium]